jgi:hypothetical protein
LLKKTFWLQIVKLDRYKDAAETMIDNTAAYSGVFALKENPGRNDFKVGMIHFGVWSLDGSLVTTPWVTDWPASPYWRSEASLAFWDGPDALGQVSPMHQRVVQRYEAYLVVNGKAAFVVKWKVNNDWNGGNKTTTFVPEDAGPVQGLPPFLANPRAQLFRATIEGKDNSIRNPITGFIPPPP